MGYLGRPAVQQDFPLTRGPMVYQLGRKGARLLTDKRVGFKKGKVEWQVSGKPGTMVFIAHTAMIADCRIALTLATQSVDGLELIDWDQGRHLYDRVFVEEYGEDLPVAPDAAFSLSLASNSRPFRHFLLEADRGTMTHDRMYRKLRAYWRWFRDIIWR